MTNTAAPPGGKFLALDKCHDDGGDAAGKMRGWAENSGGADAGSDGLLMRRPERQRRRPTEVLCASPVHQGGVALWVLFGAYDDHAAAGGGGRRRGLRDGVSEILVDAYYCIVSWRLARRSVGGHVPRR